jgi:tRNA-2-methylthio-N6-dimethylallyladenosine synthase
VLCEGEGKSGEGYMTGRTDAGVIVDFEAGANTAGKFINIEITQAKRLMLIGRLAE